MGWRGVFKITEKEERGKEVGLVLEQFSHISHFPPTIQAPLIAIHDLFQERAANREFEGNQSRVEAELGAIEEVLPYLNQNGDPIIPCITPEKYRYWDHGQSLETTLYELGACEEAIQRYVSKIASGIPKPTGAD